VLFVEDDTAILALGERMLGSMGYDVHAFGSPGEALEFAKSNTGAIRLLITDVVMPKMSGRDLADAMRGACPEIRVLFMSGYTANVIAHRGVLDEGVNFIQKPFSPRDLAKKVREALEG
jgi:DNA-binding NtrC family response regulator